MCVCAFTSETKNTQLPSAIGSVHEARGYEGEGWSAAGPPAGTLKEINPVGSWRSDEESSTCAQPGAPEPPTAIYGSGIPVEKAAGMEEEGANRRRDRDCTFTWAFARQPQQ